MAATAAAARRASGGSARDVSAMGTRMPMTTPAASQPAHEINHHLDQAVSHLDVGRDQDVGTARHRAADALEFGGFRRYRVVEGKRPVDEGALDSAVLCAPGDLGRLGARRHGLGRGLRRREQRHPRLRIAERLGRRHGVSDDVELGVGVRGHVHRRVGDEEHPVPTRDGHVENVGGAALRAQARLALEYRPHDGVRMDVAFHQGGGLAAGGQRGGRLASPVLAFGRDDADLGHVPLHIGGDGADGRGVPHQDGVDEAGVRRLARALHGQRVARPRRRPGDRAQALGPFQKIGRDLERGLAEHYR